MVHLIHIILVQTWASKKTSLNAVWKMEDLQWKLLQMCNTNVLDNNMISSASTEQFKYNQNQKWKALRTNLFAQYPEVAEM